VTAQKEQDGRRRRKAGDAFWKKAFTYTPIVKHMQKVIDKS